MVESEKRAPRQKYKRRKVEPMPATVQTAVDRGRAFQHWLDSNDYFMSDFVKDSGISRAALSAYVSGELDIASMRQDTAERLLRTMGLSDTEAWQFFNIPEEKRATFRTFRPILGHGDEMKQVLEFPLKVPLQGVTTVPVGHMIRVNPARQLTGLVVTETQNGELYALPAEMAQGRGRILGQLVAAFYKQPDEA
ncbi:hypothetical protein [Deinococcus sp. 6GRE01]|uniref:hypothetical protein n=1 Tax=Deinococcus sp. 6GRE01 TaxID=2745873 RepID=UPI001E5A6BB9|nr:hypothetical protein [Deinococcus sp. 6GRE01]MCD0155836.1 helix-turn-helix transcriptional regulator [Deinococcus sp. 6GRE01]